MDNLETSLQDYNEQLSMVNKTLVATKDEGERESLLALQSDLQQLIQLTQESLDAVAAKESVPETTTDQAQSKDKDDLDEEYALFMQEMAQSNACNSNKDVKPECSQNSNKTQECSEDSDIEDELAALLGMKCAVYHTHKWGGQPSLHNAMVSAVVPRQHNDQFTDLQVQVLFTHPTHAEMLPCPFYLDGECKFSDEQCRFSHGDIVNLSSLKEAIEPNFDSIKIGSLILLKLKPPEKEDITLRKKCSEIYHLWHRAIVKNVDFEMRCCIAKLEHGVKTGEKRKAVPEKFHVRFEDIFPLGNVNDEDSSSEESLSDTEYRESKSTCPSDVQRELLVEKSLQNNSPAMGEWERHTRGIGSKLMLSMGYVPGTGLGAAGEGRLAPVEAKVVPLGRSLDHCLMLSERAEGKLQGSTDPFKVEQRLKRLQKKEEERNKRAYEREKERERRNVFNFINKTLGDQPDEPQATAERVDIRQSTSKDLNIEKFKIEEDTKKIERELVKLNSSLIKHPPGSNGHRSINVQIAEMKKELSMLQCKEKQIAKEQTHRKDKQKMTVF